MKFHDGTEYIAVSDGFVEVRKDKVSIIVQTAETARDVERAKLAKARAESHLENDDDNTDIHRAERALESK